MDLNTYQPLALKTVTWLGAQYDRNHAALGITSEVGEIVESMLQSMRAFTEYDRLNLMEEVGDTFWYINLMVVSAGLTWSDVMRRVDVRYQPYTYYLAMSLCHQAGQIADVVKRNVIYGKEINHDTLMIHVVELVTSLLSILDIISVNLEQALDANIAKLARRYPEGVFSADRAINRDTVSEQAALKAVAA